MRSHNLVIREEFAGTLPFGYIVTPFHHVDFGRSPKPLRPSLWCTPGPLCSYCFVRLLFHAATVSCAAAGLADTVSRILRILFRGYCSRCLNPAPATETHASPADAIFMGSTGTGKGTLHSSCRLWGISGALGTTRVMVLLAKFGHPRTDPPRNSDLPRCYPASPVPLRALRYTGFLNIRENYFFSLRNVALNFSQPDDSIPTSRNNKICGRAVHTFCKGTAVQQRAEDWWTPGIFVGGKLRESV
ncbi:hypothetical protein B0H16DRAFT_1701188 [Mycena metata]|uniref:Uncharacterized protein n=1 Tax=Mycena metata TaxID=1033252 RepID=A0AAD7HC06_9AGAR|nr:hypothetical protein B0H16DRAFT_1701188 [Mycena metata]